MKNAIPVLLSFFSLLFSISAFSASNGCGQNDCWARALEFEGEYAGCQVCVDGEIEFLLPNELLPQDCRCDEVERPTWSGVPEHLRDELLSPYIPNINQNSIYELNCSDCEDNY